MERFRLLGFYIVTPAKGEARVMLLLQIINPLKKALLPGSMFRMVLRSDPQVFWDFPRITTFEEAGDFSLQSEMRQYWGE